MKYNFLITSIGSYSADCAINSLKNSFDGKFYGCDIYPAEWHAVSKKFDAVYHAPLVSNVKKYYDFILNLCNNHDINIIIPLTDIEVDFFNYYRVDFEQKNIIVTISNEYSISFSRSKKKINQYVSQNDFDNIPTFLYEEIEKAKFPLIAKPIHGRSSEGIIRINKIENVDKNLDYSNYIFQEIIEGNICTVDYIRSSKSRRSFSLPRIELLRTANGAGMTIKTIRSNKLRELVEKIGTDLNFNGCINMEFIVSGNNFYLMDVNPRLSAGIGFSKLAGYDFVKNHVSAFIDDDIEKGTRYELLIAQKKMIEVVNKHL